MNRMLFLLVAIAIASAQGVVCPSTQVYAKITKITKSYGEEEVFKILSGATVVYTSPSLVSNAERILEICIPQSTNNIYTLQMEDGYGDSWSDGAWISIEGINGNLVLKYFLTASYSDTVQFSLYSPINKNSGSWKYTANAAAGWTAPTFADETWTTIATGVTAQTATGTQYFRHAFTGSPAFAAVEVQMLYRYGAIAYLNGQEIYRDNMPEGAVTQATNAAGSYMVASYHGIVRPADVAEATSNVFAVELHFLTAEYTETIQFNGFLSLMTGYATDNKCFVLPHSATVTSSGFTSDSNALSWSRTSYAYTSGTAPGSYLTIDFSTSLSKASINGFRMWPYYSTTAAPSAFTISGANLASGPYEEVFSTVGATYTASTWKQWIRVTPSNTYNYLRMTVEAAQSSSIYVEELQFLVCNLPPPTSIAYTLNKASVYRGYEAVSATPNDYGFSNCQINPALPAGITWNSVTCTASGVPTEAKAQTTYTITTTVGTIQATGTFTLTVNDCTASLYRIKRTYKSSPQNEYFRIYDTATSTTIFEVLQGHSHTASTDWDEFICISQERFDVVFYHTGNYWMYDSYFYMYYVLPNNEQEMVVKGRYDNLEQVISNQYLRRPAVEHSQQWYYKFDSVPANWHSSDMAGWSQAARGSFPTATNKIQLYKKTFNVNNLSEVKGYILSIRYKYGAIVYLNGQEAWRNGVSGDVTGTPITENAYTDLKYHVVTLPGKTMPTTAQPTAVNYLQQGANTIAIALVAIADTQTSADFDCIVRLMTGEQSESHMWEMTGTYSGMNGGALYPFNQYYGYTIYYSSTSACTSNYLQVTLDNDRREWVSSMHIQNYYTADSTYGYPAQFKVYARNPEDADWTLLKEVTGMTWSLTGQKRRIYFQNNKSYNQFRFENIFPADHATQCKWRVQSFDFYADNLLAELPPLVYDSSVEIFKDIEMAEIIPSGEGYYDFTIAPALPAGVNLDSQTGWISGTATAIAPATTYTITANKVTGGTVTATISIAVVTCSGGRSLMTVRFRADSYSSENSWKLYQGRGTTGTVLDSVATFPVASTYYYVDFCLNDGIYTLEGQDTYGDGWSVNSGYTLTADVGAMELDIMEMYSGAAPVKVSTTFSTYFPFQAEYTEWKINQNGYAAGWNTIAFDDSTWIAKKGSEIPVTEQITTYIRKTFTITNIADYQVLNVRLIYSGGVVAYFNGNMVARINLNEEFDESTESEEVHDASVDAKFHIILPTSGMVEGTNVIAFEVHRPLGAPSSEPIVFGATGVFGVEDCSTVIDSYSTVTSTELTAGTIEGIMDLDPYTTGTLPNTIGTFVEWTVDNQLGSKWNKFNILQAGSVTSWGMAIYGNSNPGEQGSQNVEIYRGLDLAVNGRDRPNLDVPVALAGFRQYRWEVLDAASSVYAINAMFPVYCKATGATCPAIEEYPSVGEGQISPAACPNGYRGYAYRECSNGQLGEVKLDKCVLRAPFMARYHRNRYQFVKDVKVTTGAPSVRGIVSKWYIDTNVFLPDGLVLNELTGEISGTPKDTLDMTSFTVYAENASGATAAIITMSVRVGQCPAEGVFPVTEVDNVAVYECSLQGAYIGTQKRACKLGAADGEWQKASGFCISIGAIVIVILLVIAVFAVFAFVFMRSTRKAKAVGGLKGKKSSKGGAKSGASKKGGKSVKV